MIHKPIKARQHGIIDYLFSAVQLGLPYALGLPRGLARKYAVLGTGFLALNAITDTPVGLRRVISLKAHQRADAVFLGVLATAAFMPSIRKIPAARAFHLAFLGTAVANYLLSDYDSGADEDNID